MVTIEWKHKIYTNKVELTVGKAKFQNSQMINGFVITMKPKKTFKIIQELKDEIDWKKFDRYYSVVCLEEEFQFNLNQETFKLNFEEVKKEGV